MTTFWNVAFYFNIAAALLTAGAGLSSLRYRRCAEGLIGLGLAAALVVLAISITTTLGR